MRDVDFSTLDKDREGEAMKSSEIAYSAMSLRIFRNACIEFLDNDLLYSPALDILAELYIADFSLAIATLGRFLDISSPLTERWLNVLVERKLVSRSVDLSFELTELGQSTAERIFAAQPHEIGGRLD